MTPEDLANAEAEIDVWAPVGENPCLPPVCARPFISQVEALAIRAERDALKAALMQCSHRERLAHDAYAGAAAERDEWRAKYFTLESRGLL